MIKKDRNGWIAVIFLIYIFSIPVRTIVGGDTEEDVIITDEEAVLAGNGTAAERMDTTVDAENVSEGESVDVAQKEETETVAERWQETFARMQSSLNAFTEKLFLRNAFISLNSELTRALTGGTYMESTQVLLGKEDWLFYKTENDGYPVYDYMGINHFTEEELAAMANNLILARDYFEKEKGVSFIAVTIPNKEIVYEEYMPDTIARVNSVSRGEQFAQYMREHTDVRYVYPKDVFLQYKENYPLFYKTDTHWNHIGAFVGVQELFKVLYGNVAAPDTVQFNEGQTDFAGDLAVIAGVVDKYALDVVYEFDPATVDAGQKREETAIVVGDSFGGFLSVIARGYYKEVHWIDTEDFKVSMLDEYEADVVIWESVERLQEVFMQESLLD